VHRRVLAVAMALFVAACGGSPATSAPSGPAGSPLPAGTYTSAAFQPAVTFTVPDGWELATDAPTYLQLRPLDSEVAGIHLFRDAVAASQDASCPTTAEPGVGTTSSELVAWMRGLKGLTVSGPAMATIGGLRGVSVDIGIAAGWTESCSFANGLPTVPLLVGKDNDLRWVIAGSERLRLYVLDLPAGGTVMVDIDAFDGSLFQSLLSSAAPIVKSLLFAPA
jgi:hypothetical protein